MKRESNKHKVNTIRLQLPQGNCTLSVSASNIMSTRLAKGDAMCTHVFLISEPMTTPCIFKCINIVRFSLVPRPPQT